MANVVIASKDPLCQSAKNWFITQGYKEGPPLDVLKNGDLLVIIAHDSELGDSSGFLDWLSGEDFPMVNFDVRLIVCSAASMQFGKDLLTPAERIANHFQRPVYAAKGLVYGKWDTSGAIFKGDYMQVTPNTDITTLMSKLSL